MLGNNSTPSLLVEVQDNYNPKQFDFFVINGYWYGKFTAGHITVLDCPSGSFSDLGLTEIICDNQDRLRCESNSDYETVFSNFSNVNYIAPKQNLKKVSFDDMDDDIPF
jgi:hypothetical protein